MSLAAVADAGVARRDAPSGHRAIRHDHDDRAADHDGRADDRCAVHDGRADDHGRPDDGRPDDRCAVHQRRADDGRPDDGRPGDHGRRAAAHRGPASGVVGAGLGAFAFPWTFWHVPQMGTEVVEGSGCGANGDLPDTIPDGLWYGQVISANADGLAFDVRCLFYGELATQLYQEYVAEHGDEGEPAVHRRHVDGQQLHPDSERPRLRRLRDLSRRGGPDRATARRWRAHGVPRA